MARHVTGMSRRAGSACEEPVPGVSCTCGLEPEALAGHPGPGQQGRQCPEQGQEVPQPLLLWAQPWGRARSSSPGAKQS